MVVPFQVKFKIEIKIKLAISPKSQIHGSNALENKKGALSIDMENKKRKFSYFKNVEKM